MPGDGRDAFGKIQTYGDLGTIRYGEIYRITERRRSRWNEDRVFLAKRDASKRSRHYIRPTPGGSNAHPSHKNGSAAAFIGEADPNLPATESNAHPFADCLIVEIYQSIVRVGICCLRTRRPGGNPHGPLSHRNIRKKQQKQNGSSLTEGFRARKQTHSILHSYFEAEKSVGRM
jgi:hypothetical protein